MKGTHHRTPRPCVGDVRDLHLVKNEDFGLFGQFSSQSFQRVPRLRRPSVLSLALGPRVVEPPVDLEHELVEVDSAFLVSM